MTTIPEERAALTDQILDATDRLVDAERAARRLGVEFGVQFRSATSTFGEVEQLLTERFLAELEVAVRRADRDRLHLRRTQLARLPS